MKAVIIVSIIVHIVNGLLGKQSLELDRREIEYDYGIYIYKMGYFEITPSIYEHSHFVAINDGNSETETSVVGVYFGGSDGDKYNSDCWILYWDVNAILKWIHLTSSFSSIGRASVFNPFFVDHQTKNIIFFFVGGQTGLVSGKDFFNSMQLFSFTPDPLESYDFELEAVPGVTQWNFYGATALTTQINALDKIPSSTVFIMGGFQEYSDFYGNNFNERFLRIDFEYTINGTIGSFISLDSIPTSSDLNEGDLIFPLRNGASYWLDVSKTKIYMFGGHGYGDIAGTYFGTYSDVWSYDYLANISAMLTQYSPIQRSYGIGIHMMKDTYCAFGRNPGDLDEYEKNGRDGFVDCFFHDNDDVVQKFTRVFGYEKNMVDSNGYEVSYFSISYFYPPPPPPSGLKRQSPYYQDIYLLGAVEYSGESSYSIQQEMYYLYAFGDFDFFDGFDDFDDYDDDMPDDFYDDYEDEEDKNDGGGSGDGNGVGQTILDDLGIAGIVSLALVGGGAVLCCVVICITVAAIVICCVVRKKKSNDGNEDVEIADVKVEDSEKKKEKEGKDNHEVIEEKTVQEVSPQVKIEPEPEKRAPGVETLKREMTKIEKVLVELSLQSYLPNFEQARIIYDDIKLMEDEDLMELIPEKFPRRRFREYIKNEVPNSIVAGELNRTDENKNNDVNSILPISSNEEKEETKGAKIHSSKLAELSKGLKESVTFGKTLNSGAFGVVKEGKLKVGFAELPVAIKEIPINENTSLDDIEKEVQIMHEMKHENVLKCFGCWFDESSAFIVMELCKSDLFAFKKKKSIPMKFKMNLLLQTAKGMDYLHSSNLVHRDLKCSNILLTADKVVKICDFGTSKHLESIAQTFCGTVEYLAPEQFDVKLATEPKMVDIYAFGIIIWEIMSGQTPYADLKERSKGNQFELMNLIHVQNKRPKMEELPEDCPDDLLELMKGCWEKDPNERPQDFSEIVEELKQIISSL